MRASGQRMPWWAVREPRTTKQAEPELTDAEHLICLRVGRRANEGDFQVPAIPVVAAEAVALLSTAEPEAEHVARLVQRDQQLAADVIFFANSSLFAGVMKVTNIPQAITRVGFHQARTLILGSGLRRLVFSGCELERAERLWRHSLGCAAIAACIAKNLRSDPNDAYLAGLFHDVGKTVALSILDLGVHKSRNEPLRPEFVEHVIDLYHEGLGAAVALQWKLPDHVVEVIRRHTETEAAKFTKPQAIVALAENACRRLKIGVTDDGRPIAGRTILDALGAELEDMGVVLDGVRSAVESD